MAKSTGSLHRRIYSEKDQGIQARQNLLREIGSDCDGRYAVAYYTSFRFESVMISDDDIAPLEDVLQCSPLENGLLLIVSSPGGIGLASERIINLCRNYSKGKFDVLVPKQAKSAATMLCMGAEAVWMSQTSELGPIDPQVPVSIGDGWARMPADLVVGSYKKLLDEAVASTGRIEPYLQQLDHYDPQLIAAFEREQTLGEDIAVKALKQGMMQSVPIAKIKQKIKPFTSASITASHGRPIYTDEAKRCGLVVRDIDIESDLWSKVMEFHLRADRFVSDRHGKLIESVDHHFSVPISQ